MNLSPALVRLRPTIRTVVWALSWLSAAGLACPGCGRQPPRREDPDAAQLSGDPWEKAARRLRKETTAAACKAALNGLNNDLAADAATVHPHGLSPDAEEALARLVPLNDEDRAELRPAGFSAHDAVYLAECLYLRDCARAVAIPGLPPDRQADLAFAWVCRQVYLHPWLIETPRGLQATALPPTYVLRRGYGSGLERAYVFLGLLQQLELDGCLIGPPEAADQPAGFLALGSDQQLLTGAPRGPFWAVGVRIGSDVRLYDPWRGDPFPASLKQLRADPEAHRAWFAAPEHVSGCTPEDLKTAAVFLAVPVNALAPRLAVLEQQLRGPKEPGLRVEVRLAVRADALAAAFGDLQPRFWNPPADPFAYGRTARTFLPAEEGGADRSERGTRLYDRYLAAQLPPDVVVPPPELRDIPEAVARLRSAVAGAYAAAFLEPPNPRERIHRGEFQVAARELVARQDRYWQGLERLRNNPNAEAQLRDWARQANELYEQYRRARFLDKDPAAEQQAARLIEKHWQANAATLQLVVDRASADVGHAEATFLIALCKHEQAEQLQARLEYATGDTSGLKQEVRTAWAAAAAEWRTYASRVSSLDRFPGRADYVRRLSERAERMARATP